MLTFTVFSMIIFIIFPLLLENAFLGEILLLLRVVGNSACCFLNSHRYFWTIAVTTALYSFHNDTEKYLKYQYITIYFLILDIDINICIFPEKKYNIHIWRIK